eukprot:g3734.t1
MSFPPPPPGKLLPLDPKSTHFADKAQCTDVSSAASTNPIGIGPVPLGNLLPLDLASSLSADKARSVKASVPFEEGYHREIMVHRQVQTKKKRVMPNMDHIYSLSYGAGEKHAREVSIHSHRNVLDRALSIVNTRRAQREKLVSSKEKGVTKTTLSMDRVQYAEGKESSSEEKAVTRTMKNSVNTLAVKMQQKANKFAFERLKRLKMDLYNDFDRADRLGKKEDKFALFVEESSVIRPRASKRIETHLLSDLIVKKSRQSGWLYRKENLSISVTPKKKYNRPNPPPAPSPSPRSPPPIPDNVRNDSCKKNSFLYRRIQENERHLKTYNYESPGLETGAKSNDHTSIWKVSSTIKEKRKQSEKKEEEEKKEKTLSKIEKTYEAFYGKGKSWKAKINELDEQANKNESVLVNRMKDRKIHMPPIDETMYGAVRNARKLAEHAKLIRSDPAVKSKMLEKIYFRRQIQIQKNQTSPFSSIVKKEKYEVNEPLQIRKKKKVEKKQNQTITIEKILEDSIRWADKTLN